MHKNPESMHCNPSFFYLLFQLPALLLLFPEKRQYNVIREKCRLKRNKFKIYQVIVSKTPFVIWAHGSQWKRMRGLQFGSKGPGDTKEHDLAVSQLSKAIWPFLSAGVPRATYLPIKYLEGIWGKMLSALQLKWQILPLLNQRQEGNVLKKIMG